MKIINAENGVTGRVATVVAKNALLGEEVAVLNCEKAVVTGKKEAIIARFKRKREMGTPAKGPFQPKRSDRIMKRIIRGMLPYKQHKGREALKRIKCYNGVPEGFTGKEMTSIKEADVKKMQNLKYLSLAEISKIIGAK